MTEEHPFAQYVRTIGRGPNLSRPLTGDEMYTAAGMILDGEVEDLQLGAFLCILRLRTEVPEEGYGFVRAVRDTLDVPADAPEVELDWPTYSGKKRQLPWFLLSAKEVAQAGHRVIFIQALLRLGGGFDVPLDQVEVQRPGGVLHRPLSAKARLDIGKRAHQRDRCPGPRALHHAIQKRWISRIGPSG